MFALLAALVFLAGPCPFAEWKEPCSRMTEEQRDIIRAAVSTHANTASEECQAVLSTLHDWLDNKPAVLLWVFAEHAQDTPVGWVGGETVFGGARGVGFSQKAFESDSWRLARVVMHEAAHLYSDSQGEQFPERIERECVR